jgi:transcription antitermination factor NusG
MAKAKSKRKAKAKAATFHKGERVTVLSGDYGNARGTVEAVAGGHAHVRLDNQAHGEPVAFALSNLAPAGGRE